MCERKTVTAFRLNRDKSLTAIGYHDGETHLYRRSEGILAFVFPSILLFSILAKDVVKFAGHRTGVNCLAFSSDGLVLASGGKANT
jgi:WD40 repeat protein